MAEKSLVLVYRCKTPTGWKRYPAAFGRNGRVRQGYAQVRQEQILYGEGAYEVRYFEGKLTKYAPAGRSASEALDRLNQMIRQQTVRSLAASAGIQVVEAPTRKVIRDQIGLMVTDALNRGAKEAAEKNRQIMEEFVELTRLIHCDEISRDVVFRWREALRKKGNSERTLFEKHSRLKAFFRFAKLDTEILPPAPKYESQLPTIYETRSASVLLSKCDERLNLVYSLALMCGLREREIAYLQWRDFDVEHKTLRVRGKPEYDFRVKDSEERDVPVPDSLLTRLKGWHERHGTDLLFPTKAGKPDGHFLRQLKSVARDAGLNCGTCPGCKGRTRECREWTMHRFRRSYLTTLLRSGLDLRTVQAMAGHADLESTMRYLRPAAGAETQARVNAIKWISET